MILENTVPNPKSVAPKLQKLQSRKVSINVGHQRQRRRRHQSGKNYSLVEMKFRRDKKGKNGKQVRSNKDASKGRDKNCLKNVLKFLLKFCF